MKHALTTFMMMLSLSCLSAQTISNVRVSQHPELRYYQITFDLSGKADELYQIKAVPYKGGRELSNLRYLSGQGITQPCSPGKDLQIFWAADLEGFETEGWEFRLNALATTLSGKQPSSGAPASLAITPVPESMFKQRTAWKRSGYGALGTLAATLGLSAFLWLRADQAYDDYLNANTPDNVATSRDLFLSRQRGYNISLSFNLLPIVWYTWSKIAEIQAGKRIQNHLASSGPDGGN